MHSLVEAFLMFCRSLRERLPVDLVAEERPLDLFAEDKFPSPEVTDRQILESALIFASLLACI